MTSLLGTGVQGLFGIPRDHSILSRTSEGNHVSEMVVCYCRRSLQSIIQCTPSSVGRPESVYFPIPSAMFFEETKGTLTEKSATSSSLVIFTSECISVTQADRSETRISRKCCLGSLLACTETKETAEKQRNELKRASTRRGTGATTVRPSFGTRCPLWPP